MPPTLIASSYGMNFRHMPELEWLFGYPYALALMLIAAIIPFVWFKRKGLAMTGAGRRYQQGFFLDREFAFRPGTRLVAERPLQIALHEASLRPVHGRATHADAPCDLLVAGTGIGSQQDLCSLELARRMLAAVSSALSSVRSIWPRSTR